MSESYEKHAASAQHMLCCSAEEIARYVTGKAPPEDREKIFRHLNVEKCPRCRFLYDRLNLEREQDKESKPASADIVARLRKKQSLAARRDLPAPLRVAAGQVWSTQCRVRDREGAVSMQVEMSLPVMVLDGGDGARRLTNDISVLPISDDAQFERKGESVAVSSGPLAGDFLIEVFNPRRMLAGNLRECLGAVGPDVLEAVREAARLMRVEQLPEKDAAAGQEQYELWKENELRLTRYLSVPEAQGSASAKAVERTVRLKPYDKAADSVPVDMDEVSVTLLRQTQEFAVSVVQYRDRLALRVVSFGEPDVLVFLDGEQADISSSEGPALLEFDLGHCDAVSGTVEAKVFIGEYVLEFLLGFE